MDESLGTYIRRLRTAQYLSIRELGRKSRISSTYLWAIEKRDKKPGTEILQRLAPVLGVTTQELFEKAGYIAPPKPSKWIDLSPHEIKSITTKHGHMEGPWILMQIPDPPCGELVLLRESDGTCVPWHAVSEYKIEMDFTGGKGG